MSEATTAVAGEVVSEALVVTKPDDLRALIKPTDVGIYDAMSGMATLDWKDLKPNQMAVLLMQKPIQVSGGTTFLSLRQALYFAVRAYELGVSPFSPAVWFDPQKFTVNLTLEGKREVARNRGIDLGPPQFEITYREWKDIPKDTDTAVEAQKSGFKKDIGCKCRMRVGKPEHKEFAEYTAWLSEWFQPKSPLWKSKPEHMLQTRATEKTISMTLGTGASSLPDEREIE